MGINVWPTGGDALEQRLVREVGWSNPRHARVFPLDAPVGGGWTVFEAVTGFHTSTHWHALGEHVSDEDTARVCDALNDKDAAALSQSCAGEGAYIGPLDIDDERDFVEIWHRHATLVYCWYGRADCGFEKRHVDDVLRWLCILLQERSGVCVSG